MALLYVFHRLILLARKIKKQRERRFECISRRPAI
jgi:hypothetical protein